jgi:hypothetical protein
VENLLTVPNSGKDWTRLGQPIPFLTAQMKYTVTSLLAIVVFAKLRVGKNPFALLGLSIRKNAWLDKLDGNRRCLSKQIKGEMNWAYFLIGDQSRTTGRPSEGESHVQFELQSGCF